jgi:Mrp family chromosome partitioning ATPase
LLGIVGIVVSTATGLGLALGISLLRETNRRRAYTANDVEAASGVDNLAQIPRPRRGIKWNKTAHHQLDRKFSEAIRRLFIRLEIADGKCTRLGTLLVTSSRLNDESAVIGVCLARLAGTSGLKAVVVDCSLRHPGLHEILDMPNDKGLVDLLLQKSNVQDTVKDDALSDCKFITAGIGDDTTIDRCLRPEHLKNVMCKVHLEFDVIILIAPPVEESADPLMLMNVVDAALFVVRAGETTLSEIHSNIHQLCRGGERHVFTVLTDMPIRG